MAGIAGVGLSWSSSNLSLLPQTSSKPLRSGRRLSFAVRNAISVEKNSYTFQKSEEIFNAAKELMPGGVNSPVRAFKSVGGQPIVFDSVQGSRMRDIDGNEYLDYVGSWGPATIGHADDKAQKLAWVLSAVHVHSLVNQRSSSLKDAIMGMLTPSLSRLAVEWQLLVFLTPLVFLRSHFGYSNLALQRY